MCICIPISMHRLQHKIFQDYDAFYPFCHPPLPPLSPPTPEKLATALVIEMVELPCVSSVFS